MLKSMLCSLNGVHEKELMQLGECPFDQGGYFIINGSEKVLIAQERMAANHVYVFRKSQPSKYLYVAECRCVCVCLQLQCVVQKPPPKQGPSQCSFDCGV